MFARTLAVSWLLFAGSAPAPAQDSGSPDPEVVVYLGAAGGQPAGPLRYMRQELSSLMHQAGYRLSLREMNDRSNIDAEFLTVVALNGSCAIPAGKSAADASLPLHTSLATTAITDGRVLPFSSVNCTALTRLLEPELRKEPGAQRDFLYGRALARVIAHELYHAMARSTCHAHSGIAKSTFSQADLLGESLRPGELPLP